ncbi:JAB domain-containing protein [Gaoshiqia sp. Z1-71]|uniref:JAB domain-containing protein n=1 Tax=Gaoshiqia hydrogeniformans TaxID=3290090 RepID=UPI003BF8E483
MFTKMQKVVCKNALPIGTKFPVGIEKGKTYTVNNVSNCKCGVVLIDLNEAEPSSDRVCPLCDNPIGPSTFLAKRFEKLGCDIISNQEIIKEVIQAKTDRLDYHTTSPNSKTMKRKAQILNNWNVGELKLKYQKKVNPKFTISSPEDVWNVIMASVPDRDELDIQEFFFAIYLNRASEVLGFKVISKGNLESVQINQKLIFSTALLLNATGFIVAHNHPSGQLTPSTNDVDFTNHLRKAADILDFDLVDHTIITQDSALSLRLQNYVDLWRDGWYRGYARNIEDKCPTARRISKNKRKTGPQNEQNRKMELSGKTEIEYLESLKNEEIAELRDGENFENCRK